MVERMGARPQAELGCDWVAVVVGGLWKGDQGRRLIQGGGRGRVVEGGARPQAEQGCEWVTMVDRARPQALLGLVVG